MKFIFNSRQFHKLLAPWVFLPLLISAISGLCYRILKDLFGYTRDDVHWLMSLHEGEWLGIMVSYLRDFKFSWLIWMLVTGFQMLSKKILSPKKVTKGESKG